MATHLIHVPQFTWPFMDVTLPFLVKVCSSDIVPYTDKSFCSLDFGGGAVAVLVAVLVVCCYFHVIPTPAVAVALFSFFLRSFSFSRFYSYSSSCSCSYTVQYGKADTI